MTAPKPDPWPPIRPVNPSPPVNQPPPVPKPKPGKSRQLVKRTLCAAALTCALLVPAGAALTVAYITQGNEWFSEQPRLGPPGPALTFIGGHDPFPVLDHGHADIASYP